MTPQRFASGRFGGVARLPGHQVGRVISNLFGGGSAQELLDSAPFCSELLYTAIPQRAASGTTATFTRATTATVRDNEGVLRTAIAGEARFEGARRVRNLIPSSESFAAGWAAPGAASVSADAMLSPIGTLTADALIEDGTTAFHRINHVSVTRTSGQVIAVSVYAKYAGRNLFMNWNAFCNATGAFNLQTGEVTQGAGVASIEALDGGWYRCTVIGTCTATGSDNGYLQLTPTNVSGSYAGDGVSGVYIWGAQLEDITGRADQATPSEYVSVGVESAPYYHGSFVDGVKCFPTDLSGNPIAASINTGYVAEGSRTNLCLQSNAFTTTWTDAGAAGNAVQNVVGPDGATSAWTFTDASAVNYGGKRQTFVVANDSVERGFSIFVKKTSGATTFPGIALSYTGGTPAYGSIAINTNTGTLTARTGQTPTNSSIVSFNSDFWRVFVSKANNSTGNTALTIDVLASVNTDASATWSAATQGSAVFYGAQVELGSFASSYIPTTTIAVTRNADVEAVSTSGNIAAAAGSVYLEYTPTHSPSGTIAFWGTYVDASNYTAIIHDATNLIFRKRIAGVNYDATIANAFVSGTTYKACATWGASGTSITLNGTEGTPHANTTAAQIAATMQWGADGNSLQQPFASVRNCRDWLRQLSASERAAVTA